MADQPQSSEEKERIHRVVLDQVITLLLGGLSLVAALAWNEAILSLFKELFPQGGGLAYKFGYALLVTVIIVVVSLRLRRLKKS